MTDVEKINWVVGQLIKRHPTYKFHWYFEIDPPTIGLVIDHGSNTSFLWPFELAEKHLTGLHDRPYMGQIDHDVFELFSLLLLIEKIAELPSPYETDNYKRTT